LAGSQIVILSFAFNYFHSQSTSSVQGNTVHFRGNIYGNPANQFWKAEGCLTIKQAHAVGTNQPAKCQKTLRGNT